MIKGFQGKYPEIHETSYVAETAVVVGDVRVAENANIWYNAVLRGDDNYIEIGKNTNIQDNCVIHISSVHPTIVGENVTVGHNAVIHACKIGDHCLVGMGAIILNGAEIGEYTIIGAGALVPRGKVFPPGVMLLGAPAKVVRELTQEERDFMKKSADDYVELARQHQE